PLPPEYFLNLMILAPRNADIFEINDNILDAMSGDTRTYFSADKVIKEAGADGPDLTQSWNGTRRQVKTRSQDETLIPIEFLQSLSSGSLPPGELSVKV
ncbi:hypothetical protein GGX14DRAFT_316679, partial [Mycena pura]